MEKSKVKTKVKRSLTITSKINAISTLNDLLQSQSILEYKGDEAIMQNVFEGKSRRIIGEKIMRFVNDL